jgi:phasin
MNTNTNAKPKAGNIDAPHQVRDMAEAGLEQSKQGIEKMNAAATEAADVMQNSCSAVLNGVQEYNGRLLEFAQENIKSHLELIQKLTSVKSPSELLEISADHTRVQFQRVAEQTKELSALAQRATLAFAEPLKVGLAKAQNRAA